MTNKFILKGFTHPNYVCLECGKTHMHHDLYNGITKKIRAKWIKFTKCRTKGHTLSSHDMALLIERKPDILESYCVECGYPCNAKLSPSRPNSHYLISGNHYFEHR